MSTTLNARASARARPHPTTAWLLRRLHVCTGILVGPFLVVAAVTGTLYVFTPKFGRAVYADAFTSTVFSEPRTLDRQVETAQRVVGTTESPVNVRPASGGGTTHVMFADPALGTGESRAVFVDPRHGSRKKWHDRVRHQRRAALAHHHRPVHRDLLLGGPGRLCSELAATWLWALALSWTTPKVATDLGGGSGGSGAAPVDEHAEHHHGHHMPAAAPGSFDAVLATARDAGLEAQTVEIKPAASDGAAWTVSENERSWPTQVDSVAVDPHHLQVTDHVRFSEWSLPAKLAQWAVAAHMGLLFGLPNQLVLLALAAAIVVLVVSGYAMWWRRRPTRSAAAQLGPLPPRGALRAAPAWLWPVLVLVTVAVGVFLPLLGISLLGFLAVHLLLAALARRRTGAAARG